MTNHIKSKKPALLALFFCCCLTGFSEAAPANISGILADAPSGWKTAISEDKSVVLRFEKGRYYAEFSRLENELGDYYLKARLQEQVSASRFKGGNPYSDVRVLGVRGLTNAYYALCDSGAMIDGVALFNYKNISYSLLSHGLTEEALRVMLSSIHLQGEKVVYKKIKAVPPEPDLPQPESEESRKAQLELSAELNKSALALSAAVPDKVKVASVTAESFPASGEEFFLLVKNSMAEAGSKDPLRTPYFSRTPLLFPIWSILVGLWAIFAVFSASYADSIKNHRLPLPPKDLPPDFFFPFIISRHSLLWAASYNISARQKQYLRSEFRGRTPIGVALSAYACLLFHIAWSLVVVAGLGQAFTSLLLGLPGGTLWASVPELFFVILALPGAIFYYSSKNFLQVFDGDGSLLNVVRPSHKVYAEVQDEKGVQTGYIFKRGTSTARSWDFMDTDYNVLFTLRDDAPKISFLRRLFGVFGGRLRTRYGIYAQQRLAGFVWLDPSSKDKFQIHLDFAFARIAPSSVVLSGILYVMSVERESDWPTLF